MVMAAAISVVVSFMAYKLYAMDKVYVKRYDEVGMRREKEDIDRPKWRRIQGKSDGGRVW